MTVAVSGGITWSGGVRVGTLALTFDPLYLGPNLELSNSNLTVVDTNPGVYSVLTTFDLAPNTKYMFSYTLDYYTEPYSFIGIGNTDTDLTSSLGADTNSIGYQSNGDAWYDNTVFNDGYPTFETVGDVIDLAIDTQSANMWLRVNGGFWNGNISGNPENGDFAVAIGALTTGRPAISVGGQYGPSIFTIRRYPQYSVPAGYSFIGS